MDNQSKQDQREDYYFGGIKEFDLEKIEAEILNESMYLEVFAGSDFRFKKNVMPLKGSLEKLLSLKGVQYEWRHEQFKDKNFPQKKEIGLIAQDVQNIFPELTKEDADGYLMVNYAQLAPALIEGIRELSNMVAEQSIVIEALCNKINGLEKKDLNKRAVEQRL